MLFQMCYPCWVFLLFQQRFQVRKGTAKPSNKSIVIDMIVLMVVITILLEVDGWRCTDHVKITIWHLHCHDQHHDLAWSRRLMLGWPCRLLWHTALQSRDNFSPGLVPDQPISAVRRTKIWFPPFCEKLSKYALDRKEKVINSAHLRRSLAGH